MTRSIIPHFVVLVIILGLLVGCSSEADYTARFVRYSTSADGKPIALVSPIQQQDEEQAALTDIPDLKPGEFVLVHYSGRSWESLQSAPEREIVSRALRPLDMQEQRPAFAPTEAASVGTTVELPIGEVTLRSVTTTAPHGMGESMNREHDPDVWLNLEYLNSTDGTVTVMEGFRSPPRPDVVASGGLPVEVWASSSRFTGGDGGWGPGRDGVRLAPGGVVYASFGLRVDRYVAGTTKLKVSWQPAGDAPARFETP